MLYRIPVSKPSITSLEKRWVNKALDSGSVSSTGGFVEIFEEKFAEKLGVKYVIGVSSGYAALFLALKVLGIKEGDEVIMPTFTMIACPNAVVACGAKPVFVDAEWDTANIDFRLVPYEVNEHTKAIMPVHIYGHPCDLDNFMSLAKMKKLKIVEDCAEAHGAKYNNKFVGSIGDVGCFSFYGNKIFSTGEGGAITTNNKDLANEVRRLRAYYFPKQGHFWHEKIGWNFRLSSLNAALGIAQIERWNELIEKRDKVAEYYDKHLEGLVEIPVQKDYARRVNWYYFIKTPLRDKIETDLEKARIETRRAFTPMHLQPIFKDQFKGKKKQFPVSEKLMTQGIYLPTFPDLKQTEQDLVISTIQKTLKKYVRKRL